MKKLALLLATVLCLSSFVSCDRTQTSSQEVIRVVLDWTPNTNHTGLYVAQQLGYFEEAGLTVEIVQPPESGALPLVGAGNAEYAFTYQDELGPALGANAPLPIHAVAAIINHNTSGIISLSSSNITSPKDLENHRLAAWDSPLIRGIVDGIVTKDGGNPDNVEMVFNNVTDVVSGLQSDLDAVWIYYAWDGIATEVAGLETNFFYFQDYEPVFDYYTPVLVVNDSYAAENSEKVDAFVAALSRGYEYCMENLKESADILLEQVPELNADIVYLSQQYLAEQYQADAPRWGEIDEQRWTAFFDWMYDNGLLENPVSNNGFTNEHLPVK